MGPVMLRAGPFDSRAGCHMYKTKSCEMVVVVVDILKVLNFVLFDSAAV